jgi:hypothetical protein
MQRQEILLSDRYDLSDRPIPNVMMSGGRKAVQGGVRVKLPEGVTWESLAQMAPQQSAHVACCQLDSFRCHM